MRETRYQKTSLPQTSKYEYASREKNMPRKNLRQERRRRYRDTDFRGGRK